MSLRGWARAAAAWWLAAIMFPLVVKPSSASRAADEGKSSSLVQAVEAPVLDFEHLLAELMATDWSTPAPAPTQDSAALLNGGAVVKKDAVLYPLSQEEQRRPARRAVAQPQQSLEPDFGGRFGLPGTLGSPATAATADSGAVARSPPPSTGGAMGAVLPALGLTCVLAAALAWMSARSERFRYLPRPRTSVVVAAVYVGFSVAIDLSIAVQKKHMSGRDEAPMGFAFNPACVVVATEILKFGVSLAIYCCWRGVHQSLVPIELSLSDTRLLALPAVIFAANNVLVFEAIGQNDISAFGVFRDTMILWTAALWKFIFKVQLGWVRVGAIGIIFVGLTISKISNTARSGQWSWLFLWVLAMTLCNSAGSVANEYALRCNGALNINVQNMILYALCAGFALLFLVFADPGRLSRRFFDGFDAHTWLTITLQCVAGLLVSRILKQTDAITKTVATCLRGPAIVALSPILGLEAASALSLIASLVVASGCFLYLSQGAMQRPDYNSYGSVVKGATCGAKERAARANRLMAGGCVKEKVASAAAILGSAGAKTPCDHRLQEMQATSPSPPPACDK